MVREKTITIILLLIFCVPILSLAQRDREFQMEDEEELEMAPGHDEEVESIIELWHIKGFGAFIDSMEIDTTLDNFQLYHPMYKNAITTSYVGNYGTPYINNDFFGRKPKTSFFFLGSRDAYILTPEYLEYYNTTTPYTVLDFTQSENRSRKNETRFNVLHSQNVSPHLNFTFRFDQARSDGQYNYQESKNNFVTLYSSYNKNEWNVYSGFISNLIKNNENGGLTDEATILDSDDSEFLKVNLAGSDSHFSSTYFFNNSEYRIGKYIEIDDSTEYFRPIIGLGYSVTYERHRQEFREEEAADSLFFRNSYYSDEYINDSIRFHVLNNTFQIKQYENTDKKVSFGKRAFIGHQMVRGSFPGDQEHVNLREQLRYSNSFVGGGIFRETGKKWQWNFDGKLYLTGRRSGQTELNGVISKPLIILRDSTASIVIDGSIENLVADPFQEKFYSNHYQWNNDFKMEQRMMASGKFISKKRKLEIGARYAILNNYLYVDTLGIPAQTGKELIVLSAFLDKDFNYKNLHFRTRVLWQKASNEELIHLPKFSTFVSAYYKFLIAKVMYAQIGSDVRYNTAYYADAYSPATGLFYLQSDKKYGNFPYIDAYVNLKLKRTKFFFKMMNLGSNFIDREYITTPNYPMNRSTYRIGVAWTFYD